MTLTADDVRTFIQSHHRGVLATLRGDGLPQLSPVLVGVDDDGSLIISTREPAMKTANVRRRGWASVCVFDDAFFGQWVQAEGPATVESLPSAMDGLVRYMGNLWVDGARSFFYKGTNGRWRAVLGDDQLAMYERTAASVLTPACQSWLKEGRSAFAAVPSG